MGLTFDSEIRRFSVFFRFTSRIKQISCIIWDQVVTRFLAQYHRRELYKFNSQTSSPHYQMPCDRLQTHCIVGPKFNVLTIGGSLNPFQTIWAQHVEPVELETSNPLCRMLQTHWAEDSKHIEVDIISNPLSWIIFHIHWTEDCNFQTHWICYFKPIKLDISNPLIGGFQTHWFS